MTHSTNETVLEKVCIQCGATFVIPYRVTRKYAATRRYCTPQCSQLASRGRTSPLAGKRKLTLEECFWPKVDKRGTDECWIWIGARETNGYGILANRSERGVVKAHRLSYELHFGKFDPQMEVCHHCDNPPCVNPSHLFLGTHLDNMRDRSVKQRTHRHMGSANGRSRLTHEAVQTVRAMYESGCSQAAIAKQFGVTQSQVSRVVRGVHWAVREV
jgi:hypothetical protein